jgi:hypothetical protein
MMPEIDREHVSGGCVRVRTHMSRGKRAPEMTRIEDLHFMIVGKFEDATVATFLEDEVDGYDPANVALVPTDAICAAMSVLRRYYTTEQIILALAMRGDFQKVALPKR